MTNKLEKIDIEIKEGKKYKACDRLRNLINENPNNLELYDKLATIYFESGFYDAAGKYWILIEPKNEKIKNCVEIYKKSVNNSGTKILQDLKFGGTKSELNDYAKNQLEELEKDSFERSKYVPNFGKEKTKYEIQKKYNQTLKDKIIEKIGISILIAIPILIILGIVKVYEWIVN
jgi:hypothetical protein